MTLRIRCVYIGAVVIACAVIMRIVAGGGVSANDRVAGLLTYFYTGKLVNLSQSEDPTQATEETKPISQEREDPLQISLQAQITKALQSLLLRLLLLNSEE